MNIKQILNKDLTYSQKKLINNAREKEWGKSSRKDFKEDFEKNTLWFFLKDKNKTVALAGLRPIRINYLNKDYHIGGICSFISIVKKKGYGKILSEELIKYSKKNKKTILGFTVQTKFFKKTKLKVRKGLIKRFVWIKKDGEKEYDSEGDGIYFEGMDKFIKRIINTKKEVPIEIGFW